MGNYLRTFLLIIIIFLISCFKQVNDGKNVQINRDTIIVDNRIVESSFQITKSEKKEEENGNDEFISDSLFNVWKGRYILKQENQIDGWGRESISFSELSLIQPDSCVFKSWLADSRGQRYLTDDNYQEYVGGILATNDKDSIEFYTKKVVSGSNGSLSPLLSFTKTNKNYFIYSFITSPPNNGIIKMPIEKQ